MAVVGFQITKLFSHAITIPTGQISVSPHVHITNVQIAPWIANQRVIQVHFKTGFTYVPNAAVIDIEGVIHYSLPEQQMLEVENELNTEKKIPQNLAEKILTTVFQKTQTLAIILAKECGLPSPVPLPKLKVELTNQNANQKPELNSIDE
jgi:hypothetical protein